MSTFIHPTAIIDSKTVLDEDVKIGPYCIIGPNTRIGKKTRITALAAIEEWTEIGEECTIGQGVIIGSFPQDTGFEKERSFVKIGDRNLIREYTTIHRGSKKGTTTHVGNDNFFMAYSHIAHNCLIEDGVVIANAGTLAGYVTIEKKTMIGGLSAVHQYVKVGAYSIIGGCSKVVKDIPPYTKADGRPARLWGLNSIGLKRADFALETRSTLKRAYTILFRSSLNTSQALKKIENELEPNSEIQHLCQFIQSSKRGICKER